MWPLVDTENSHSETDINEFPTDTLFLFSFVNNNRSSEE